MSFVATVLASVFALLALDGDAGDRTVEVVRDIVLTGVRHHAGRDREQAGRRLGLDGAGWYMDPRRVARVGVGRDHYLAVVAHPVRMGLRRLAHLDAVWRYVG